MYLQNENGVEFFVNFPSKSPHRVSGLFYQNCTCDFFCQAKLPCCHIFCVRQSLSLPLIDLQSDSKRFRNIFSSQHGKDSDFPICSQNIVENNYLIHDSAGNSTDKFSSAIFL